MYIYIIRLHMFFESFCISVADYIYIIVAYIYICVYVGTFVRVTSTYM